MKLDKMQFAKVLVYIAGIVQRNNLDSTDINVLDDMIDIEVPAVEQQVVRPSNENIERLMALIAEGTKKIEAIKEHRAITGMTLKESKDTVERYWPDSTKKYNIAELKAKLNQASYNADEEAAIMHFLDKL